MVELLFVFFLGFLLGRIGTAPHNTAATRRVTEVATRCGQSIEKLGKAMAGEGETWAGLFPHSVYEEAIQDLRELVAATKEMAGGGNGD